MTARERFKVDRAQYEDGWVEPGLWAVAIYRFGQFAHEPGRPGFLARMHRLLYFLCRAFMSIELPHQAQIGPGLRIWHQGPIVFNDDVVVGARCVLRHGVTLGAASVTSGAPTLGDDVFIGANVTVLGGIHVGDGAKLAAGSVVIRDVPAGTTVAGVPAKPVGGGRTGDTVISG